MTRPTKIFMVAVFAVMSACSGGVTPPDNTCKVNCNPPPVEIVTVAPISPTQGAVVLPSFTSYPLIQVAFSAQAVSSVSGLVTNLSWTLNGVPVGTTVSISAGTYNACVTATAPSGKQANTCFSFTASLPVMSGTLKSVMPTLSFPVEDFVPKGGMIAVGSYGSFTDTVAVGTDGKWQAQTRWALKDTAYVCPIGEGMMPCGNGIALLKKDFANVGVVTAPNVVTIPTGSFAGQQVVISLAKARAPSGDGNSSFYNRYVYPVRGFFVGDYVSYPVPAAFCRSQFNYPITAKDSAQFWVWITDLHQKFGRQLLRPANEQEVCGLNGAPRKGISVVIDTTWTVSGGGVDNQVSRDYVSGRIIINSINVFHIDNFVIQHEMIHALGFGHTCSWSSIMYTNCKSTPDNPTAGQITISREDVAYALYMMAVVDEMRKLNTFYSVLNQAE